MAITTTSHFSDAMSLVVGAQFLKAVQPLPIVSNLFAVMNEGTGLEGKVAMFPDVSGSITDPVSEGSDATVATADPTSVTLTPSVTGIAFEVTDLLTSSTPFSGLQGFVSIGADALVQQSEDDIHALFAALNGGTRVGASGAEFAMATMLQAVVTLKQAQVPGPYFAALAPQAVAELAVELGGLGGMAGGTSMGLTETAGTRPGLKGVVAGVPVYECPRAVSINTNADRESLVANTNAITSRVKWTTRAETQRDALGVSTHIVVTNAYGVAETADTFGVPIQSDHE